MSNAHVERHPSVKLAAPPVTRHARQAYELLHWGFVIAPAIAGLDKFVDVLTRWDKYLAPAVADRLPVTPHSFMVAVGVAEIVASLVVAVRPRVGAYIVAAWPPSSSTSPPWGPTWTSPSATSSSSSARWRSAG